MSEDFTAAAKRHWADAGLLAENERRENADHHYGFAAECALKYALQEMGYFRDEHRRWHIEILWNKLQAMAFQKGFPGLVGPLSANNPFSDWHVNQRYHADGMVSDQAMRNHEYWAQRLLKAAGVYRG
jgi:hypothetical protein